MTTTAYRGAAPRPDLVQMSRPAPPVRFSDHLDQHRKVNVDDISDESRAGRVHRRRLVSTSSVDEVHPVLQRLLRAAVDESLSARGSQRREAFRTVRALLAGCRILGQPRNAIALLLGVRAETIASRDSVEGDISIDTFARLAGLGVSEIEEWERRGDLPLSIVEPSGRVAYPAVDLLAALIRHHGQRW